MHIPRTDPCKGGWEDEMRVLLRIQNLARSRGHRGRGRVVSVSCASGLFPRLIGKKKALGLGKRDIQRVQDCADGLQTRMTLPAEAAEGCFDVLMFLRGCTKGRVVASHEPQGDLGDAGREDGCTSGTEILFPCYTSVITWSADECTLTWYGRQPRFHRLFFPISRLLWKCRSPAPQRIPRLMP